MTHPESDTPLPRQGESRRRFFKFLAASPLAALAYYAVPSSWLEPLLAEARPIGTTAPPADPPTVPCVSCGAPVPAAVSAEPPRRQVPQEMPPQNAQEEQLTGTLVSTPEAAVNVWDFERVAHENNLAQHWDYLHMGVDDYETRVANRQGFQRLAVRPRRLAGEPVTTLDMSIEILGQSFNAPLFLCPVAALQAYHTEGEAGAGRAARRRGVLQIQSNVSSMSYEEIAEARGQPHWFQIYTNADWNRNQRLIDRVAAAGCPTLVWTVDLLGGSNRELARRSLAGAGTEGPLCQNCHNHQQGYQRPMARGLEGPAGERPPYTWDYIRRLKDASDMNLVVKGIVTGEDADQAIEHGADAIYVSNHGGRAENSMWATIDSLPEVVAAVQGRVPVLIDSGVRRGIDVFKALALGADAVGIGRPYVWGLGAFGEQGVDRVIQLIMAELSIVMRQTQTRSVREINSRLVMEGHVPIMTRQNQFGFGL
jgi:isopentenyl diphosphate isomerase/L-lactate dehydrogenase-like FMN-dependent dehydrogenase